MQNKMKFLNNISFPDYTFCYDETKSTHGGTGFFNNENISFVKRKDFNILSNKNLESTSTEVNLPKKRIQSAHVLINIYIMPITYFNSNNNRDNYFAPP